MNKKHFNKYYKNRVMQYTNYEGVEVFGIAKAVTVVDKITYISLDCVGYINRKCIELSKLSFS